MDLPGDLAQNERYQHGRGKKVGKEGLPPGCNFPETSSKFWVHFEFGGFLTIDFFYYT